MNFDFTEEEVALVKRALRVTADSTSTSRQNTDDMRQLYDKIRRQETVNKLRKPIRDRGIGNYRNNSVGDDQ